MDLIHNVGVLFHAEGNLAAHLARFGDKLFGLEKQSRGFNKQQEEQAKFHDKWANTISRHTIAQESAANRAAQSFTKLQQKREAFHATEVQFQAREAELRRTWSHSIISGTQAEEELARARYGHHVQQREHLEESIHMDQRAHASMVRNMTEEHHLRNTNETNQQQQHARHMARVDEEIAHEERKAKIMKVAAGAAVATAGVTAGVMIGRGVLGFGEHVAKSSMDASTQNMKIEGMGVSPAEMTKVKAALQRQTDLTPGVTYTDAAKNFIALHDILGSPQAVLGTDLKHQNLLSMTSKAELVAKQLYGMSDGQIFQLERASHLASASTKWDQHAGKMVPMSPTEIERNWEGNFRTGYGMTVATGGKFKFNEFFNAIQMLKQFRFTMSPEGMRNLMPLFVEGKGGVQGNAVTAAMMGLAYGKQAIYLNNNLVNMGLLHTNDKSLLTLNAKGGIIGHQPMAMSNWPTLTSNFPKWIVETYMPKVEAMVHKQMGNKYTQKDAAERGAAMLSGMSGAHVGRTTAMQVITEIMRQYPQMQRTVERAKHSESIEKEYDNLMDNLVGQTARFNAELEKLSKTVGDELAPSMTTFLHGINDLIGGFREIISLHPTATKTAFWSAAAMSPAVAVVGMSALPLAIASVLRESITSGTARAALAAGMGEAITSATVAEATSVGLATSIAVGFASAGVISAVAVGIAGLMTGIHYYIQNGIQTQLNDEAAALKDAKAGAFNKPGMKLTPAAPHRSGIGGMFDDFWGSQKAGNTLMYQFFTSPKDRGSVAPTTGVKKSGNIADTLPTTMTIKVEVSSKGDDQKNSKAAKHIAGTTVSAIQHAFQQIGPNAVPGDISVHR